MFIAGLKFVLSYLNAILLFVFFYCFYVLKKDIRFYLVPDPDAGELAVLFLQERAKAVSFAIYEGTFIYFLAIGALRLTLAM